MGAVVCKQCGEAKPESEYYSNRKNPHWCIECRKRKNKEHRKLNPDTYRGYEYKKKYGINLEQYNEMLAKQEGKCAICLFVYEKPLTVDHDHLCCPGEVTCGKCIRGLLCGKCNLGISYFNENIEVIERAITYVKLYGEPPWKR